MDRADIARTLISASREAARIADTVIAYPNSPSQGMDRAERESVREVRNSLSGLLEDTKPKGDNDAE